MAERLAVAEDRLARMMREDNMKSLAEAKLQLAQADFDIMELQVASNSGLLISYHRLIVRNGCSLNSCGLFWLHVMVQGHADKVFLGTTVCVAAELLVSRCLAPILQRYGSS